METPRKPEFSQCFGDKAAPEELTDADLLTTVEFDETGTYLATGDRGGRVVIFEKGDDFRSVAPCGRSRLGCKYRFYTEFQSHEGEFDYLKSLEIEEKINQIKWCRKTNGAQFLISANDKTIKLWKVHERKIRAAASQLTPRHHEACVRPRSSGSLGSDGGSQSIGRPSLRFPRLYATGSVTTASNKRSFCNAHAYHINSLSVNNDGETFLSADDLRINLWNVEVNDRCFNIVDIKPANMEELNEVITSAAFHPEHCNVMMFSSSKGAVRLTDMRASALCDQHGRVFEHPEEEHKSFFSEIISSVSDAKFSRCGRYIYSRDYLTLKVWDTHMESRPVSVIKVHEELRQHLAELYECDSIFDKFECSISGCGRWAATGTYNNVFQVHDREGRACSATEISRPANRRRAIIGGKGVKGGKRVMADGGGETIATDKKIMHLAWHPTRDILAIAGLNRLYFYTL